MEEKERKPKRENFIKRAYRYTMSALKRCFQWVKRMFFGGSKHLSDNLSGVESPTKLYVEGFFRRKSAVVAAAFLLLLFLFVFIAPAFVSLDVNYTDPLQQNVPPTYSLRAMPKRLQKGVAETNGFADFTVGVSSEGELFLWGNTKDRLKKTDLKEVPNQVKQEGAAVAAAGKDHVICVTKKGNIVGWGDNSCGQYGTEEKLNAIAMPQNLALGISPSEIAQLVCGYQATALVMKSGKAYVWGNINAVRNLADLQTETDVKKAAFSNSSAIFLKTDGSVFTGQENMFTSCVSLKNGRQNSLNAYMVGRKAVDIAANNKCIALLLEDGDLVVSGAFENGEDKLPALADGEKMLAISGGTRHFVGVTDKGNAYAWGDNAYGQSDNANLQQYAGKIAKVYAGALQTYAVDGAGNLLTSIGLKGYLMGTDGRGRDVFARIVYGGKMTMTVGAVAVIISSIIAIIVGCLSGYFGGWVDTLLMRLTEIFSSIPFLPFAMLLSQIIKNYNVSEGMRIFIIMLILGALSWTGLARMIRGQVLAEREKEFVVAAKAMGVKEGKIAFKHILPNIVSVILVSMTLDFASCLLTESALSYLGFGVQQPQPTWGNMLSGANSSTVIQFYWWQWLFPALFLSLATVSINLIGDALRDVFDPKSRASGK